MRVYAYAVLVAIGLVGCASAPPQPTTAALTARSFERLPQTPPGAINEDVTQATINQTICVPRWTETVRPPTSYTNSLKEKLLQEHHLAASEISNYELDHFIPLALGGHPRSPDNLWLQPWDGEWGAHVKDRLERKLQLMVCAGKISLSDAREAIRSNWIEAFKKYVDPKEPLTMPPVD